MYREGDTIGERWHRKEKKYIYINRYTNVMKKEGWDSEGGDGLPDTYEKHTSI